MTEQLNWTEHILSYWFSICFIWRRSSWICRIYLCFQVGWGLHCSLQKCLLWVEMSYSPTNCTADFNKSMSQILCHPHWHLLILCLLASKHKTFQAFHSFSLNEQLFLIRCPDHILEKSYKSDPQLSRARQHFITAGVVITDFHKPSGWTQCVLKFKPLVPSPCFCPASPGFYILLICVWEMFQNILAILHNWNTFKFIKENIFEVFIMLVNGTLFLSIKIHFWHSQY